MIIDTNIETINIEAELIFETDDAYLIDTGEGTFNDPQKGRHWLPKSKTEWDCCNTFNIPEWLASEKGLI